MSNFEQGLNDMVGGKPIETGGFVKDDFKPKYHKKDIESYQGRWINMYFLFNGESDTGSGIYDNEKEAAKEIIISLTNAKKFTTWKAGHVLSVEISHGIPLPIK